ncbi:hypothetical protein G6F56_008644 [Rhizopus delemar]|nr:hypothetical protein G6F56_008644 [Rhizopus delemar]
MDDTVMSEATHKKEKPHQYNVYTIEDRKRYFYFLKEKLMKPKEAVKAANVNYDTARKGKKTYEENPEREIPTKKTNLGSNRPVSQLNENHKAHLINFFDEDSSATIQDAVDNLTTSFAGLQIKNSRGAEFMKEECSLNIKVITRHPLTRNKQETLKACADWSGFDINMRRSRGRSKRRTQAIVTVPSAKGVSPTIIGAISALGVANLSMRESGNTKKRKVVRATKRKAPEDRLSVPEAIMKRGYTPIYLLPYSPELNPIEQFCAVVKGKVKRNKLSDLESLTSRNTKAGKAIPV